MKKAAIYARVSTALQERERTIESQIEELKKQVASNSNVLVKEYIDDGYSGAKMDRPALDQLRNDLKTDLFDAIYFHNSDRIARDVTYQNLIIAEILKYKKQIFISGKDYIHNPENKFTLTVLGAVAELERAKIIERSQRGKLHKLRQGILLGNHTFGYDIISKTKTSPCIYKINEKEAAIIRYIFKAYAIAKASWSTIVRYLEDTGATTKMGSKLWDPNKLTNILNTRTYTGTKYFNTRSVKKDLDNPLRKIKYSKKVYKNKSEWIGVKVPAIISQELFDKAQERLEESRQLYRNPKETQLLSHLVRCGECGKFCTSYQRYYRYYYYHKGKRIKRDTLRHKVAYRCSRRTQQRMHSKKMDIIRCKNPEIAARLLENEVFNLIKNYMIDPKKLQSFLNSTKASERLKSQMEIGIRKADQKIEDLKKDKKQTLNLYANGKLNRSEYTEKCLWLDNEVKKVKLEKDELITKIPNLQNEEIIDVSLRRYCETVRARLEKCSNFETKREFLLEYISEIIFVSGSITINSWIPVTTKNDDGKQGENKLEFSIKGKI